MSQGNLNLFGSWATKGGGIYLIRMEKKLLKIGEAAKILNVPISTIRFYSDIGLLDVDSRTAGGFRLYDIDKLSLKLKRIKELVEKGLTISQIKEELAKIGEKLKILVVDDDPEVGSFFIDLFKDYETEVKVVYDGFQAGLAIGEFRPDLIILDLLLPGINGFEICRRLKSDEKTKDIKILAITAYDTPEHREEIKRANVDDYYAKPLDVEKLLQKINNFVKLQKRA